MNIKFTKVTRLTNKSENKLDIYMIISNKDSTTIAIRMLLPSKLSRILFKRSLFAIIKNTKPFKKTPRRIKIKIFGIIGNIN